MAKVNEFRNKHLNQLLNSEKKCMSINQLDEQNSLNIKNCYSHQNLSIFTLGEVIEISSNQYGLSLFSGMISVLALGVYTLLTVDAGNDDDDSDSGSGGLMQPVN